MSAPKHTPGPLHVGPCADHPNADEDSLCFDIRHADGSPVRATPEDKRLWAASPELAEALMHALLRGHPYKPGGCDGCARAEAALKKAGVLE